MILLDTHIWVWWVNEDPSLIKKHRSLLENLNLGEAAISIISCWEIAKKVEVEKLKLKKPVSDWLEIAIKSSAVAIIPIDLKIILDSTSLPGKFHKDPADQLIVATARVLDISLLTADEKILKYKFVKLV
ncbi:MAG: type II toxin-antitoxin system VapC family toxin [Bacteroidia bacterium]|nr:type II toxin-antitoxin system VapC family toxin [Bacteroidia bacterium]